MENANQCQLAFKGMWMFAMLAVNPIKKTEIVRQQRPNVGADRNPDETASGRGIDEKASIISSMSTKTSSNLSVKICQTKTRLISSAHSQQVRSTFWSWAFIPRISAAY